MFKFLFPRAKRIFLGNGINCLLQEQAKKHVLLFVLKIIIIRISKIANKEEFLFRALQYKKGKHLLSTCNKPISYSRVRELFRTSLDKIGLDKSKFGLHSLRSEGATSAANNSVADSRKVAI